MLIHNSKKWNLGKSWVIRCLLNIQLIILVAFLSGFCTPAIAQINTKICIVDSREYPGRDPVMWDGLYAASDGKVYSGLITEGASAHFYMYDPTKDVNVLLYDLAEFLGERGKGIRGSCKIHNKPVEDSQGNLYFVTMNDCGPDNIDFTSWQGGHWMKYNPKENELTDLGLVGKGIGCYALTIDKKRNIFCDDEGNVYASFPVARVCKYDAQKEKVYDLSVTIPYDPTIYPTQLVNPMIDRSADWRAVQWDPVDKVAYGVTCGSGSILFRFDPHEGPEGKITALTKMCATKFLDRKDVPFSSLAFTVDSKNKKVYFVPSARSYSIQRYAETLGSEKTHHLIMYDIKADKRVDLGAMKTRDGRRVFGCEGASVGPNGTVYICGQVEVKNKEQATRFVESIPTTLQLIIYKPE